MKHTLLIICSLLSLTALTQDVTQMIVVKDGQETQPNEERQSDGRSSSLFSLEQYLNTWNPQLQRYERDLNVLPSLSLEYDLSKEETAHFYDLGCDLGNHKLMAGASARIPSHSPDNDDGRGIQFSFRVLRMFEFNQIVNPYLRSSGSPKANFQIGMEYIADTKKIALGEDPNPSRRTYVTPFIGLFHPIYQNLVMGVRYKYNVNVAGDDVSYAALALQCNFTIPLYK